MKKKKKKAGAQASQKPENSTLTSRIVMILIVLILALLLRVVHLQDIRHSPFFYHPIVDEESYDRKAQAIAAGAVLGDRIFYQDPFYPYFLGTVYWLTDRNLLIVRVIQIVLGAFNALIVFGMARKLFGDRAGMVAGFLAAVYPVFIFYEGLLLKSSLSILLSDLALLAFLHAMSTGRSSTFFLSGLALGGACLTRGNFLLFFPLAMILSFFFASKKASSVKTGMLAALALTAGVGMIVVPVTIRNAIVGKDFVIITSQAGQNFYIGNNEHNPTGMYVAAGFFRPHPDHEEADFRREAERRTGTELSPSQCSKYWFKAGSDFIRSDPGRFFKTTLRKVWLVWSYYELPDNHSFAFDKRFSRVLRAPLPAFGIIAPLGILGIVFAACKRRDSGSAVLMGFIVLYSLSVILFYVFSRYRLPMVPPLIVFAGYGVTVLIDKIRERNVRSLIGPVVLLAVFFAGVNLPRQSRNFAPELSNLGHVYLESRQYDKAMAVLEEAVEADPDFGVARFNLAKVYDKMGRFAEARAEYESVHRLLPQLGEAWNNHGAMEEKAGDLGKAEEVYQKAIASNPSLRDPYFNLGRLYERQGKPDKAADVYIKYLNYFSDNSAETQEIRQKLSALK
ncbi:tetratricopeptide repeat protein [Acidobacteriota bacterium]